MLFHEARCQSLDSLSSWKTQGNLQAHRRKNKFFFERN